MYKISFSASEGAVKAIEYLQEKAGLENRGEVFRKALGALHWVLEQFDEDRRIVSLSGEAYKITKNSDSTNSDKYILDSADISELELDLHLTEN